MAKNEQLFQLVKSLNQGEKWNFRVYAGKHSNRDDKNYMRLFDAIEKQDTYDETVIRRQFKGEKFLRRLPVTKSYLYQMILDSLRIYHSDDTPERQVQKLIHQVELLFHKDLPHQALIMLKRARKMAKTHQLSLAELRIVQWEEYLTNEVTPSGKSRKKLKEIGVEHARLVDDYKYTALYARLMRETYAQINQYGIPRNKKDLARYRPIIEHPLMQSPQQATTRYARVFFYGIQSHLHYLKGQLNNAYECHKLMIQQMESGPEKGKERAVTFMHNYVSNLHNCLDLALSQGLIDDYFEQKIHTLRGENEPEAVRRMIPDNTRAHMFINYYSLRLKQYRITAQFEKGKALLPDIQKGLKQYPHLKEDVMGSELYLSLTQLFFFAGEFDKALPWLNALLNHPLTGLRKDVYGWIKIMASIIHFELGNDTVMEHYLKSIYRYLLNNDRLFGSEKAVLRFFRRDILKVHDGPSLRRALKKLHHELLAFRTKPFEVHALQQFDLLSWLESKIDRRPIAEVVKEKSGKAMVS